MCSITLSSLHVAILLKTKIVNKARNDITSGCCWFYPFSCHFLRKYMKSCQTFYISTNFWHIIRHGFKLLNQATSYHQNRYINHSLIWELEAGEGWYIVSHNGKIFKSFHEHHLARSRSYFIRTISTWLFSSSVTWYTWPTLEQIKCN